MNNCTLRLKRWLRNLRELLHYTFGGKVASGPDNHIVKLKRIRRIGTLIGAKSFVETGTFYGQTTEIASYLFDAVISIELSPYLAEVNASSFKHAKNVTILQGDSRQVLPCIVNKITPPILFWLDGHYSGGITAGEAAPCPILEELSAIHQFAAKTNFCILIDDRRLFNGSGGYPQIDHLNLFILNLWPDANVSFDKDAIIVYHHNGLSN